MYSNGLEYLARRQRKGVIQTDQQGQRHNKVIHSGKWREPRVIHREWDGSGYGGRLEKKNHKWP